MSDTGSAFLTRPKPPRAVISLVPMIDVLLILLVFFMVTSTYLNLDMIPAVQRSDASASASQTGDGSGASGRSLLLRIGADGVPRVQGGPLTAPELDTVFRQFAADFPSGRVLVLPSGAANMQALISVLDAATRAGVTDLQVVRLEANE